MVTAAAPSYSHATEPRAVANRSKFRAPEGADGQASNIMFDRRVVRGSTYAQPIDTPVRYKSRPAPPGMAPRQRPCSRCLPCRPGNFVGSVPGIGFAGRSFAGPFGATRPRAAAAARTDPPRSSQLRAAC
jgi:hypothetical protein